MTEMSAAVCENFTYCQQKATQRCSTCNENNFLHSQRLGHYCSRECQTKTFRSHKYLHKLHKRMHRKNNENDSSGPNSEPHTFEAIVVAFQEIITRQVLPPLDEKGTFCLLLIGTSNETSFVYDSL